MSSDFPDIIHAVIPFRDKHKSVRIRSISGKKINDLYAEALTLAMDSYSNDHEKLNLSKILLNRKSFDIRSKDDFQATVVDVETSEEVVISLSYKPAQVRSFEYTNSAVSEIISDFFSYPCAKPSQSDMNGLGFCLGSDAVVYISAKAWMGGDSQKQFVTNLQEFFQVSDNQPRKVVLDLRGNTGGSTAAITEFLCMISDEELLHRLEKRSFEPNFLSDSIEARGKQFKLSDLVASSSNGDFVMFDAFKAGEKYRVPFLTRSGFDSSECRSRRIAGLENTMWAVLTNGQEFSATESFLSFIKGHRRFTIYGRQSRGGTGSPVEFSLPYTKIKIRLSRARQIDGVSDSYVIEGKGILPDIRVSELETLEAYEKKLINVRPNSLEHLHDETEQATNAHLYEVLKDITISLP